MKGLLRSCLALLSLVCVNAFAALSGPSSSTGNYTLNWTDVGSKTCYNIDRSYAYELKESKDGATYTTTTITDGATQSYSFTNKSPGSYRYYLRVRKCSYSYAERYYWFDTAVITVNVTEVAPTSAPSLSGASSSTGGTVYIDWNSIAGASRYQLEERNVTAGSSWVIKQNTSSRTYGISNLSTARYEYRVSACNSGGCSSYSSVKTLRFVNPPGNITTITFPGANFYGSTPGVTWNSVADESYYKISTGSAGSSIYWFLNTTRNPSGGSTETFSLALSDGSYHFKVQACKNFESVVSCSSARQSAAFKVYNPPGTPGAFSSPSTVSGDFSISWGASSGTVTDYQLQRSVNGGNYETINYGYASRSYTQSSVAVGTYRYRVRGINYSYGNYSDWSYSNTITAAAPGTPGTPSGPNEDDDGGFTISWSAVSNTNSYRLEQRKDGVSYSQVYSGSGLSHAPTGLSTGVYDYHVQACNSLGCGSFSGVKSVNVARAPSMPTFNTLPSTHGASTLNVSWAAVSGANAHYDFDYSSNGGASWSNTTDTTSSSRSVPTSAKGSYIFRVRACSKAGTNTTCSGYRTSSTVTVLGIPATPSFVGMPSSTGDHINVAWSSSDSATDHIMLEVKRPNTSTWKVPESGPANGRFTGQSTSYLDSYMQEGSNSYRIKACNSQNYCSSWKEAAVYGTKPSGLTVISSLPSTNTSGNYSISWSTTDTLATKVDIEERLNGNVVRTISRTGASSGSYSITGKSTGRYSYRLRNCNIFGCSSNWSSTSNIDVARAPAVPSFTTLPSTYGAPTLTVSWNSVSGAAVEYEYKHQINTNGWSSATTTQSTSASFPSSAQGAYSFEVRACDKSNSVRACSAWRTSSNVSVVGIPGNPSFVNLPTSIFNPFDVSWTAPSNTSYVKIREQHAGSTDWFIPFSGATTYERFNGTSGTYHDTSPILGMQFYRISACNSFDYCSGWVNTPPIYGRAPSHAPSFDGTLSSSNNGNFNLTWGAVQYADRFKVERKNGASWNVITSSNYGNSQSVSESSEGSYTYRVTPCNYFGCEASVAGQRNVDIIFPVNAPYGISAADVSNGDTSIFWWPRQNSSFVTEFVIQHKQWNTSWVDFKVVPATTTRFDAVVDDFPTRGTGGSYEFRIAARKTVGQTTLLSSFTADIFDIYSGEQKSAEMLVIGSNPKLELVIPATDVDGTYEISWVDPNIDHYNYKYVLQEYSDNNWKDIEVLLPWYQKTWVYDQPEGTYTYRIMVCAAFGHCGYDDVGTIVVNYESLPTFTIPATMSVNEGQDVSIAVSKSGSHTSNFLLSYFTRPLDATEEDFIPVTGEIEFTPSMSNSSIEILTVDDSIYEGPQQFELVLTYDGAEIDVSRITIQDNDVQSSGGETPQVPLYINVPSSTTPGEDIRVWWNADLSAVEGTAYQYELDVYIGNGLPLVFNDLKEADFDSVYSGQASEVFVSGAMFDSEDRLQWRLRLCNGGECSAYRYSEDSTQVNSLGYQDGASLISDENRIEVGSIPYSLSVGSKGAANIQIPIDVVPGPNGMQPAISLVYNSNAAPDASTYSIDTVPFGGGWSVGGTSEIRKCSKGLDDVLDITVDTTRYTWEIDNDSKRPNQTDSEERICLDGQLLVLVSGNHLEDGAEYRTYKESYTRVVASTIAGTNLIRLTAYFADGRVAMYGHSPESRVVGGNGLPAGKVNVWALTETKDSFGNFIQYQYHMRDGIEYGKPGGWETANYFDLYKIWYGKANGGANLGHLYFEYDSVDNDGDGVKDPESYYLSKITVRHGSFYTREYTISTFFSGIGGNHTLKAPGLAIDAVQVCSYGTSWIDNGDYKCLSPLKFKYDRVWGGTPSRGSSRTAKLLSEIHNGTGVVRTIDYAPVISHCDYEYPTTDFPATFDGRNVALPDGYHPQEVQLLRNHDFIDANEMDGIESPDITYFDSNNKGAETTREAADCRGGIRTFEGENFTDVNDVGFRVGYAVVAEHTTKSETPNDYETIRYDYRDSGFYDTRGNGFAGYGGMRITNTDTGDVMYKTFRIGGVLSGMPYGTRVYKNGRMVSESISVHDVKELAHESGNKTYLPVLVQSSSKSDNGEITSASVKTVNNSFSDGFVVGTTTTTKTGSALVDNESAQTLHTSYQIDFARKDVVGNIKTITEAVINENFIGDDDWRIGFVSSKTATTSIAHSNPVHATKSVSSSFTPWNNTMAIGSSTIFAGYADKELTTTYEYDAHGNVEKTTVSGPSIETRSSSATYVRERVLSTTTNALGHVTKHYLTSSPTESFAYDKRYMVPTGTVDPNGITSRIELDWFGRTKKAVDHFGNEVNTRLVKCNSPEAVACTPVPGFFGYVTPDYYEEVYGENLPTSRTYFDLHGRAIRSQGEGFNGGYLETVDTIYDDLGRVYKTSLPYAPLLGETPEYIQNSYDELDRIVRVDHPSGSYTTTAYSEENGLQRVEVTNQVINAQNGNKKKRRKVSYYNHMGQLVETIDAYLTTEAVSTTYDYDAAGNVVEIIVDGNEDAATTMEFDDAGRRVLIKEPNSGTTRSVYDALGLLKSTTDAEDRTVSFEYDLLGRMVSKTEGSNVYEWFYDPIGGPKGVLWQETHNTNEYVKTYLYEDSEVSSRLTSVTEDIEVGASTETGTTVFTYDDLGRLQKTRYASGNSVSVDYNDRGFANRWTDGLNGNTRTLKEIEHSDSRESLTHYLNGVETYTQSNRYTGLVEEITHSSNAFYLQQNYQWDSAGNLEQRMVMDSYTLDGALETFEYNHHDALDSTTIYQVLGGQQQSGTLRTLSYDYDALGNLKLKKSDRTSDAQVNNYEYANNNAPHQLTSAAINSTDENVSFEYNNVGAIERYNFTSGEDKFVKYNAFNKPVEIVIGSSLTDSTPTAKDTFKYGPDGSRYKKVSRWLSGSSTESETVLYFSDGTERTIHAPGGQFAYTDKVMLVGGVQSVSRVYSYGAPVRSLQFLHGDHLGSIVAATDENGEKLYSQAFEPFGARREDNWEQNISDTSLTNLLDDPTISKRGYTGHEHLDRVGLIHMNGRVYDPTLGRFLSPDPVVQNPTNSQNFNRYMYVYNNPLRFTDPSGYRSRRFTVTDFGISGSDLSGAMGHIQDRFFSYILKNFFTIMEHHLPDGSIILEDPRTGDAVRLTQRPQSPPLIDLDPVLIKQLFGQPGGEDEPDLSPESNLHLNEYESIILKIEFLRSQKDFILGQAWEAYDAIVTAWRDGKRKIPVQLVEKFIGKVLDKVAPLVDKTELMKKVYDEVENGVAGDASIKVLDATLFNTEQNQMMLDSYKNYVRDVEKAFEREIAPLLERLQELEKIE